LLSVAALVTVPFISLAAHGHQKSFRSNVVIHYRPASNTFDGHVGTARVCKEGRTVLVQQLPSNAVVGSDTTDHSGHWGPVPAPGPGTYYARVTQEIRGGYGGVVCLEGVSHTVTVP